LIGQGLVSASRGSASQDDSAPSGRRHYGATDWPFTLTATLIALLPRLFVAIAWAREPVWDGHYYHFGAERLALGLGYSEDVVIDGQSLWRPWVHYPVGYSALLGAIYKLFGSGLTVAPITNAIIGALLVLVVHRLARHYLTSSRARWAAGLVALHPGLIAYSAVVMNEVLAAVLVLTAVLAAVRFRRNSTGALLGGAVLGVAALVRPSTLLVAPLLALKAPRPWWLAILRSLTALAVAVIVVLPWTVRNCRMLDGCALVSTNAGWNLAIGALTETGRFRTLRAADGCPVVTGQVQQDRCWARVGLRIISTDFGGWLARAPSKLSQTFDHESFAVEYLHEADPANWPEPRRRAARGLLTLLHRLLLVGAAFGVVARPWIVQAGRERTTQLVTGGLLALLALTLSVLENAPFYLLPLAMLLIAALPLPGRPRQGPVGRLALAILAATALTHVVFFGDDRYHIVITPILCLLAAAALRRPAWRAPSVSRGELTPPA
jgi:4-amino-4-deoxy-L-arabinose transferase-like glycosyltransferase